MKPRAVVYVRASLDMTGEGASVARQQEACEKLADLRGWDVVAVDTDNSKSAYGGKERPGWAKVLDRVRRGEDEYIVAWHLDRITRSMTDLEDLIQIIETSKVGIATATGDIDLTNDMGRMVARILAAVARAEVERKAARQRLGNQQLAASGKPWRGGSRPFGYSDDHMTLMDPEAEAIRWAAKAVLDGTSMREVARRWNEQGFRSARGEWSSNGIKKLLTSPRYIGVRTYLGEEVGPGTWPAIIDADTHRALTVKFSGNSRFANNKAGRTPSNLLSGIATCDVCSQPMTASRYRDVDIYGCRSRHSQPSRAVLDARVTTALLGLISSPGFLSSLAPTDTGETEEVRIELDGLHRRLEVLASSFATGVLDERTFTKTSQQVRDAISTMETSLAEEQTGLDLSDLAIGTDAVVKQWPTLELPRQRAILDRILTVVVTRAERGTAWTTANVRIEPRDVSQAR